MSSLTNLIKALANGVGVPRVVLALWAPASIIILGLVLLALGCPWLGAPLVLLGALDVHGRYRDYRWLWDASAWSTWEASQRETLAGSWIEEAVVSTSNFVYFGRSFCGRQVVCAVDPTCRDDYLDRGYRWYHLLPDGFPRVLKKKQFWINMVKGHRT